MLDRDLVLDHAAPGRLVAANPDRLEPQRSVLAGQARQSPLELALGLAGIERLGERGHRPVGRDAKRILHGDFHQREDDARGSPGPCRGPTSAFASSVTRAAL